jgi:hypothetical protein
VQPRKQIIHLAALTYLWAFSAHLGARYIDALFLRELGANNLPFCNVLLSLGMVAFSLFLMMKAKIMGGKKGALGLAIFGVIFYSSLFLGIKSPYLKSHPNSFFILKLLASVHYSSLITTLWNYIGSLDSDEESSRSFGIFATIGLLGCMSAGMIIHSFGGESRHIFLILISLFTLLSYSILKNYREDPGEPQAEGDAGNLKEGTNVVTLFLKSVKHTLSNPKTQLMLCINFSIYFMWVIAEYYSMSALESWHGGSMIKKYGLLFGMMSIPNILFGLFFYRRLVARIGIEKAILLTPLFYLIACSGTFLYPSAVFPITLFFIIIEGPFDILENSNYNTLIRTLPSEIRFTTRVVVEFCLGPMGYVLSGLFLTFSSLEPSQLGLVLAVVAVGAALTLGNHLRKEHRKLRHSMNPSH